MIQIQLQKQLHAATGEMLLDVDFKVVEGTILALYGKSGVGKTSILRILAGLMETDRGQISMDKFLWLDTQNGVNQKPQYRRVGMVFQDYALFPNMTIRENLEFALEKRNDLEIVNDLITMMELEGLQHRKPATLSGGQQQRVALARSMVQYPRLLLLDEPLSALDTEMREKLQDYILKIHRQFNLTIILVSHDQREIERLADRVLLLENGKIVKDGTPEEIFHPNFPTPNAHQVLSTKNIPSYVWGEICKGWKLVDTAQLAVIQESMPPNTQESKHFHYRAQQFFYILKGQATFLIAKKQVLVEAGQGIHILPKTNHQIKNESGEDLEFLVISQPHSHGDREEV